jgi:TonB family protein
VFDADHDAARGQVFLVMEYLDGEDLRVRLARKETGLADRLALFAAVLEPLAAAHSKAFVHRDLKPENVFIARERDGSERVKLLDFGIARQMTAERLTQTGLSMGTPHYMSPEQWRSAKASTPQTDVWAFGVMLYEALTGEVPFGGETPGDITVRVCTEPHVPLATRRPELAPALSTLVDRCLAKDPAQRPADATALLAEFRTLATQRPDLFASARFPAAFGIADYSSGVIRTTAKAIPQTAETATPSPTPPVVVTPNHAGAFGASSPQAAFQPTMPLATPAPALQTPAPHQSPPQSYATPPHVTPPHAMPHVTPQHVTPQAYATPPHVTPQPYVTPQSYGTPQPYASPPRPVEPAPRGGALFWIVGVVIVVVLLLVVGGVGASMMMVGEEEPTASRPIDDVPADPPEQPIDPVVGPEEAPPEPVHEGSLPAASILQVVDGHRGEVQHCYERELASHPGLTGTINVRAVISPTGAVSEAAVESSTLANAAVEECVVDAVKRWQFDAPQGGSVMAILPFDLAPHRGSAPDPLAACQAEHTGGPLNQCIVDNVEPTNEESTRALALAYRARRDVEGACRTMQLYVERYATGSGREFRRYLARNCGTAGATEPTSDGTEDGTTPADDALPDTPSRESVQRAFAGALPALRRCAGTRSGMVPLAVTFIASGRVSMATAGGEFAGTREGDCMSRVMRGVSVPPFRRPMFQATYPVNIRREHSTQPIDPPTYPATMMVAPPDYTTTPPPNPF